MNIRKACLTLGLLVLFNQGHSEEAPINFGRSLCQFSRYECLTVERNQSWESLFPDPVERDIVQRINRTYNHLSSGKEIAVPKDLKGANLLDYSPFPKQIGASDGKLVIVDQDKLAWAAYDPSGQLVKWGPVSSGSDRCSDNSSPTCRTLTGVFYIFSKENENCRSNMFPLGRGGARMPYCMYYHKGYALHGSSDIPGYRASHGCVRMFDRDAKWLNQEFVDATAKQDNFNGTRLIVRPLLEVENL